MQRTYFDILFIFLQRLKSIFHGGLTIFLSKDLKDHVKLKRYIVAYPLRYLFVQFNENWARKTYVALVDSVRNHTFLCFVSKIGSINNESTALQLEFSGFNPNRNQPRIVNQCFQLFEERNFRLKSGQRNAKCPTSNPWYSYNGKSVFGFAVFKSDQCSSTIYLKSGFRVFAKKRSITTAIAIFSQHFICYAILS